MVIKFDTSYEIEGVNSDIIERLNRLVKETKWEFSTIGMLAYYEKASSKYWFAWNLYLEDGRTNSPKDDRILIDCNLWIRED